MQPIPQSLQEEDLEKYNTPIDDEEEGLIGVNTNENRKKQPNSLAQIFQVFQKKNADEQKNQNSSFALLNQSETVDMFDDDNDDDDLQEEGGSDDENEVLTTNYWKSKEMKERLEKRTWKNLLIPKRDRILIFFLLSLTCVMCIFVLFAFVLLFFKVVFYNPTSSELDGTFAINAAWIPSILEHNLNIDLKEITEKGSTSDLMIFNLPESEITSFFANQTLKDSKRNSIFEKLNSTISGPTFHPIRVDSHLKNEKTKETFLMNFVKGSIPSFDNFENFVKKNWFFEYFNLNYDKITKKFSFSPVEDLKAKSFSNFWIATNLDPSQSVFEQEKVKKIFFYRIINSIQIFNPLRILEEELQMKNLISDKSSLISVESKKLKEVFNQKNAFISCTKSANGSVLLKGISFCVNAYTSATAKCPTTVELSMTKDQQSCFDKTTAVLIPSYVIPKQIKL